MATGFFSADPQTALMDPDVIAAKRKLLLAADAERRKIKPIQHWTQGAAMLANALADKQQEDKLNEADKAGNAALAAALSGAFGATPAAASSPVAASVPGGAASSTPGATSAPVVAGKTDLEEKFGPMFGNAAFKEAAAKVLAPKLAGGAAGRPDSISGMNPDLTVGLARAATDAPGNVAINSGYRSPQLQAKLFDAAVMKYGSPQAARKWVAPAGRSQHNVGNAADLGMDPQTKAFMHQNAGSYGLKFPMAHEPWHIEAIRGQASNAPQAIAQATAANPAATPAAAPVAAPAATGGQSNIMAALAANPALMKRLQKNPVALAMLMQQMKSNSPAARLALQNAQLGIDLKRQQIAELAKGKRQVVTRQDGSIITVDPSGRSPAQVLAPPDNARAPVTKNIKQPDGSEVAVQWEPKTQTWKPMVAPEGGKSFNPKLTEGQSKDQGFYVRGFDANKILTKNEKALTSYKDTGFGALPGIGNSLVSNDYRRASRAARDVLSVILRKDTGAAVTPQEFSEYGKIFIPAPGDDAATIKDKATARALAIDAIKRGLGNTGKIVEYATKGKFSVDANGNLIQGGAAAPAASGAPKAGTVDGGYRFKGGDPADQNNWEKVR